MLIHLQLFGEECLYPAELKVLVEILLQKLKETVPGSAEEASPSPAIPVPEPSVQPQPVAMETRHPYEISQSENQQPSSGKY